ncbi:hypothetical protein H4582DRAFT_1995131, partial [Lactarius indigo]
MTTPHATPETSTSAPLSSTPPPAAVAIRHNPDLLKPFDAPNLTRSTSNTVLNTTESHRSIIVTTAPTASPRLTSTPAAPEGEGSMEAALHMESDTLAPSGIQENIIATSDLPSQPLPSPSVTDVAIASPSRRSLGAEHTGDHSPYPLHSQYDI